MSEIDQLFEQAATLTGDERSQFLDGLTVAQRRAVEKLLAAAASLDNHGSFLQGEPDDATLPPRANPDDEVTIPPDVDIENEATLVPEQSNTVAIPGASPGVRYFGEYELLEELARGGMGVVFRARQVNLNRIVALKMILSGNLAGEVEIQRFKAEAEAAANLDHPGIVPIFEIGEHEGQHYFSMGFVDGESLQDRIRRPLPPREAAELAVSICDAIAYAHDKGVIHRDLKPANVLLEQNGTPRITDFGLAKQVQGGSNLTQTGAVMGTPGYMPPEQASGDAGVGPLADVYSLGAVLYCMLTGRPPFQAASSLDTLMQVMEQEPVSPRELDSAIPQDLETITLKCLEKNPERRYASAAALRDDLSRFLSDEPIEARPPTFGYRFQKSYRRNRVVFHAAGLVTWAAVCAAAVSFWMSSRAGYAEAVARSEQKRAIKEAARAKAALKETEIAEAKQRRAKEDAETQRGIAEAKRKEAEELSEQNQQQLVASQLTEADRFLSQNDPCAALPHLLEAFRVDSNPDHERLHRTRIAATWNAIPKFTNFWKHDASVNHIAFSPDRQFVATSSHSGHVEIRRLNPALSDENSDGKANDFVPTIALNEPAWNSAFSPDGSQIVIASGSGFTGQFRTFDLKSGDQVGMAVRLPEQPVRLFWNDQKELGVMAVSVTGLAALSLFEPNSPVARVRRVFQLDVEENPFDLSRYLQTETGRYIQFRSQDLPKTTVRILNLNDNLNVVADLEHPQEVIFGRLSADGKTAVTVTREQIRFWDLATKTVIAESPADAMNAVGGLNSKMCGELSFDGKRFTAGMNNEKSLTFFQSGNLSTRPLPLPDTKQRRAAPNGRWIAFEDAIGTVRIFDLISHRPIGCPLPHSSSIRVLRFTPDCRRLVTGCNDGTVRVWDLAAVNGVREKRFGHVKAPVIAAEMSADESELISMGYGWLVARDVATNHTHTLTFSSDLVGIDVNSGSDLLAFTTSSNIARVFNRRTRTLRDPIRFTRPYIHGVDLSNDGTKIATLAAESGNGFQKALSNGYVHNAETGELILGPLNFEPPKPKGFLGNLLQNVGPKLAGVGAIKMSPNNRHIAYGGAMLQNDGLFVPQLKLVDLETKEETKFDHGKGTGILYIERIEFSKSGRLLLSVCQDPLDQKNGELRIWDMETRETIIGPVRHAALGQAEFSDDERLVAVAADTEVYLYDAQTGEQAGPALRHSNPVSALSLHGNRLATATRGQSVHDVYVWDLTSRNRLVQPLLALPLRHTFPVNHVTMLDENRVMVCSHFEVNIYKYQPDDSWSLEEMQQAAGLLTGRELTSRGVIRRSPKQLFSDWEAVSESESISFASNRQQLSDWYNSLLNEVHVFRDWPTEIYHRAFQMRDFPDNTFALGLQADAFAFSKEFDKAQPFYQRSYEAKPDDAWRMYKFGSVLLTTGDLDGLKQWAPRFIERFGKTEDVSAAGNLCKVLLLAQVQPDDVNFISTLLAQAVKKEPDNLWARSVKALHEFRSEQISECDATCASILKESNDNRQKALAYSISGLAKQSQENDEWKTDIAAAKKLLSGMQQNVYGWYDTTHVALLIAEADQAAKKQADASAKSESETESETEKIENTDENIQE